MESAIPVLVSNKLLTQEECTGNDACMSPFVTVCNFLSLISSSVFTVHSLCQSCVKLLLMKNKCFLLLQLHIKSIQSAKDAVAFIVKQSQEIQCSGH